MAVLGDHQKYSHFAFFGQSEKKKKKRKKKRVGESVKILDIWENQNGSVHAHGIRRKCKNSVVWNITRPSWRYKSVSQDWLYGHNNMYKNNF